LSFLVLNDFEVPLQLLRDQQPGADEDQDLDGSDVVMKLVDDVENAPLRVLVPKPPLRVRDDVEVLLFTGVVPVDSDECIVDRGAFSVLRMGSGRPVLGERLDRLHAERSVEHPCALGLLAQDLLKAQKEAVFLIRDEVDTLGKTAEVKG
jgi:hypothetical protein